MALWLTGLVVLSLTSLFIPIVQDLIRMRHAWQLETESMLFMRDLELELSRASRLWSSGQRLYARVPVAGETPFLYREETYEYYLDHEGRIVRRVQNQHLFEGYTIMLESVKQWLFHVDGSRVELEVHTHRGQVEHVFRFQIASLLAQSG